MPPLGPAHDDNDVHVFPCVLVGSGSRVYQVINGCGKAGEWELSHQNFVSWQLWRHLHEVFSGIFLIFFCRFWGAGWGSNQKPFGKLLLVHFAAVLFRKGCVLVDFFPTCWALGLRCLVNFGRPRMVWGQDTWHYEVRQRNRYAKDDHLGSGFKDLDYFHPYPWENDPIWQTRIFFKWIGSTPPTIYIVI